MKKIDKEGWVSQPATITIPLSEYHDTDEELKHLKSELEKCRVEIVNLSQLNKDACNDDTEIRELCRRVIGAKVDGDSNGVPTLVDVVEQTVTTSEQRVKELVEWGKALATAAQDNIDYDQDNQCAVCHCCGMELDGRGKGHRSDCLADLTLSTLHKAIGEVGSK